MFAGKFGAVFASIPFPIFAALYCVLFGLVGMLLAKLKSGFLPFSCGQSLATKFVVTLNYNLINIFLLEVNFDKFTIRLHILFISFTLAKFLEN